MGKILEPNIKVEDIKIEADSDSEYSVNRMINEWGHAIPLVKIGDYVLQIGEVISCHVYLKLNELPSFEIQVRDDSYKIREALKKQIDKCVIFFGFRDWYVKFNGLITNVNSDSGELDLFMNGIFYQEPLYITKQKLWKETSVIDIIQDICTETKLGLFTFDNNDLNYVPDVVINPNKNNLNFTKELINRYTNNIFCYDTYGYLHIGDIESILKQPVDKYTISPKTGESIPETDFVFHTRKVNDYDEEKDDLKIYADYYTIGTNFSLSQLLTSTKYSLLFDDSTVQDLKTDSEIGYGEKTENTFIGFSKHKFPFYTERVNKLLCGNLIKLKLRQVMYEIVPFSLVNLELYLPSSAELGKEPRLDEEHSGKHMVIGYSYDYDKQDDEPQNHIEQTLYLI